MTAWGKLCKWMNENHAETAKAMNDQELAQHIRSSRSSFIVFYRDEALARLVEKLSK